MSRIKMYSTSVHAYACTHVWINVLVSMGSFFVLTVYTRKGQQMEPIRPAAVEVPTPMFLRKKYPKFNRTLFTFVLLNLQL